MLRSTTWKSINLPRVQFGSARSYFLLAAVVLLIAMAYMAQGTYASVAGRNLRMKRAELDRVKRHNAVLRSEIAHDTTPDQIAARANQIGLMPPARIAYADWVPFATDTLQVLPAAQVRPATVMSPGLWDQVALWWDSVLVQLGFSADSTLQAGAQSP